MLLLASIMEEIIWSPECVFLPYAASQLAVSVKRYNSFWIISVLSFKSMLNKYWDFDKLFCAYTSPLFILLVELPQNMSLKWKWKDTDSIRLEGRKELGGIAKSSLHRGYVSPDELVSLDSSQIYPVYNQCSLPNYTTYCQTLY